MNTHDRVMFAGWLFVIGLLAASTIGYVILLVLHLSSG